MTSERRQHTRLPRQEHVKVDVVTDGVPTSAEVFDCSSRDFSLRGIRLHGDHPIDLGSHVDMTVHMKATKTDYHLTGKVKWVTVTTENEHLAGVELVDTSSEDMTKWQSLFES